MNPTGFEALRDIFGPNGYELKYYPAPGTQPAPFAIICPGGGYSAVMSCIEGKPYAQALNEKGYAAFVLRYRVRNRAGWPAPMLDLARAVRWVLAHAEEYRVKPDGYAVFGSSAGAHLAALFGVPKLGWRHYGLPRPGALVLCYPVITMGALTHAGSRDWLLGKAPAAELAALTSAEQQVTAAYPPTFLWCGTADKTVDPRNSRAMAAALAAHGVPHRFVEYPGVDHGVGLGQGLACEGWLDEAVTFWQQQRGVDHGT